jgi:methylmalonyl-CoA mutase N-terminal domain/subunit
VEAKEKIIVGVNEFTSPENVRPDILVIGAELEKKQIEKIRTLRHRRDNARVRTVLGELKQASRSSENVVPRILAAVEAYATLGEIADTLRKVFGEYRSA